MYSSAFPVPLEIEFILWAAFLAFVCIVSGLPEAAAPAVRARCVGVIGRTKGISASLDVRDEQPVRILLMGPACEVLHCTRAICSLTCGDAATYDRSNASPTNSPA